MQSPSAGRRLGRGGLSYLTGGLSHLAPYSSNSTSAKAAQHTPQRVVDHVIPLKEAQAEDVLAHLDEQREQESPEDSSAQRPCLAELGKETKG